MTSKLFGRLALLLGAILLVSLFAWEAFSAELSVVQVYRPVSLSEDEVTFRDFYINGGASEGLKKNLVINVVRKMDMKDATGTQAYGDMFFPTGQLRILFVGPKVSVAREYKGVSFESSPVFEQPGIQIGDQIDLKGSYVDNKKLSPHNKTAEANSQPTRSTSAVEVKVDIKPELLTKSEPVSESPPLKDDTKK